MGVGAQLQLSKGDSLLWLGGEQAFDMPQKQRLADNPARFHILDKCGADEAQQSLWASLIK